MTIDIGKALAEMRVERNLRQKDIADRMGVVSTGHIASIEAGRLPTWRSLTRYAKALGVPVWKVVRRAEEKENQA